MKKRLLIVDDITEYLEVLETFLEDNFVVIKATNKEKALELLQKTPIEIAVVDIRLKDEDPENKEGLEVLNWIKKHKPHIKVLVMSAYKEFDYAVEALNLGADYFLKKPIDPQELLRVLDVLSKN